MGKEKVMLVGFYKFLCSVEDGQDFLDRIKTDSNKNSACMRAVPIGVLPDVKQVIATATVQATVTHNIHEDRFYSRAIALMAYFATYESLGFEHMADYLIEYLPSQDAKFFYIFDQPWDETQEVRQTKTVPVGITTVHDGFHIITTCNSLMEMKKKGIEIEGDTDSVNAIT